MEIHQMLCISTAHLSVETREQLQFKQLNLIAYPKGEYGWFIPLPPEKLDPTIESYDFPEDLTLCFGMAEDMGMTWLMIDRDGPVLDGLPVKEET